MPRIDRYILTQLLTLFGFFALVLVSVYWLNQALSLFEQLIADGQTALVVLEFTLLTLPVVIARVLPVAGFAAVVYAINRLSGDSEMTAMHAAGLSPWRLGRPVLVFGLLVGLMVAVLVHGIVPAARAQLAGRQAQLSETLTAQFLQPGSFQYPMPGLTLYIRAIAPDGRLLDLLLEDARSEESRILYTAREAVFLRGEAGPRLVMMDGMAEASEGSGAAAQLSITRFQDLTYDFAPLAGHARRTDLREVPTAALFRADPDMLAATGVSAARAHVTAQQRLAQPLLSPVAVLLGFAALMAGGFSRFGLTRPIALSILLIVALQFLNTAAEDMAERDPTLWPVLYLPMLVGAGVSVGLLAWAGRWRGPKGAGATGARGAAR